ncbi:MULTISPECIES: signal peptidase I [unclassified Paenibacillus]|uniref:signal peptidase I n=1 Tax=unclassified Paenibacillus TaxID=185978 RepID=UPI0024053171|nr:MULTISPECIES: signal peptidase I [unclassified Paenibacillus]MDF9841408.1 signal peptidase I [Paenibacillus sp. PastF-2]MDF9847999.1 signal peptidase I [Paenibacillus sp. PastM-2]MDF9854567.1 signal peptidase I [Paenibacillus sp. PastF-1]MDH6479824.1 signal peptidase I [Paenibacillus sp. PastH-2]MDH6507274.1 signal peptidase I [Paenibacillus sp. PastM-3]
MQQDLQQGQGETVDPGGQPPQKQKNEVLEWVKAIAIALVLVVLIRWLLFKPFIVDGPSMQPNFHTGERVIVNEILYDIRSPQRGEVIVFHVPSEGRDFIKRVIAVAGDTVKVEGDVVTVNGEPVDETYIQEAIDARHANNALYNNKDFPNEEVPDGTVPEGHVFVMGDNRSDSTDSRMIGYVPLGDIVGRADLIFWPVQDISIINH